MVVPVNVLTNQIEHFIAGALFPTLGVDGLGLHPAEEALRGGVVWGNSP